MASTEARLAEPDAEARTTRPGPWGWVPSLYLAEGLPYVVVMTVSVIMYKGFGISNTEIALQTSWLYLPWVIKPLWAPVVDILGPRLARRDGRPRGPLPRLRRVAPLRAAATRRRPAGERAAGTGVHPGIPRHLRLVLLQAAHRCPATLPPALSLRRGAAREADGAV